LELTSSRKSHQKDPTNPKDVAKVKQIRVKKKCLQKLAPLYNQIMKEKNDQIDFMTIKK